jgi:hypothetical protein
MTAVRLISLPGRIDEPQRLSLAAEAAMDTFRSRRADPRSCYEAYLAWLEGDSESSEVEIWRIATAAAIGQVNRDRLSDYAYRLELVEQGELPFIA